MHGHIEGLLSTGEIFAALPGVAEWFPIADQVEFVRDATADPLAYRQQRARLRVT